MFAGVTTAWKTFNRRPSRLSPSQRDLLTSSDRLEYIRENELDDDVQIVNNSRPKAPILNDPEDE